MFKKVVADEVTERLVIGGAKTFDKVLYFYLSPDKKCLILSSSAKELLNHVLSLGYPLTLSLKGISFFLQSGVIPTPSSIYEEVYVLSIGDYAAITSREGKLEIEFYHEFPYPNSKRIPGKKAELDKILSLLAKSILRKIDPLRKIFLFQSVGKDSNTILLALIEAGLKDNATALTLALPGSKKDESNLASEIAKK
jgi:asparagine synthase (glutamine-hydrolysing)